VSEEVVKRLQAVNDLDDQAAYLQQESPESAIRFLEQAEATFDLLAQMPRMGRLYDSDNPRLAGLRYFRVSGFEKHLIFYQVVEGGIEVLRVLHGARDIPSILERSLD
jgi:toxin ParE1/3/4